MSNKYVEQSVVKLMEDGMTRVEALVFMKKVTTNRIRGLSATSDANSKVFDKLLEDLVDIEKMIEECGK